MNLRALALLIFGTIAGLLYSQSTTDPAFEVATVKLNKAGGGNGYYPSPGRLRIVNMNFAQMIQAAHHVKTGSLIGASGWMQSEGYDIEAKSPDRSTFDEQLVMLRALLADRFGLRFHRETREMTTLALMASKNGTNLRKSSQEQKERVIIRPGEISGTNIPFGHFVTILSAQLGLPVNNETGVSGEYDLALKYVSQDAADAGAGPSLYAALQEQLGLRLERRKGPVEVVVIDSAERPKEN